MVRGGKVGRKQIRSRERASDDSDDDYVVSDDDRVVSDGSEDYCSSLDGKSFDNLVEEKEERIEIVNKFNRSKARNGVYGQWKNGGKTSQTRGRVLYADKIREEYSDEDFDYDVNDDEEFTPGEEEYSDEEEEQKGIKKKSSSTKKVSVTSTKVRRGRRRSSRIVRKPFRKNGRLSMIVRSDDDDDDGDDGNFIANAGTSSKKKPVRKRRRLVAADSDSDRSTDYEYTISEEEREQIREAQKLCATLKTNSRSSSLVLKNLHQQRKPPAGGKGKEKLEDVKSEVGKQVCGICLSEEDKKKVIRGVLNCCTHYFCFGCIMEWAKVESRCPLCKQRFVTISKPARSTTGIHLRQVVIQVPERDQVYMPSEEELRSYIDPYEYVICSVCRQGGDDGLMLLCDLCDSPAHTYCVGLGHQVPEGNWYCEVCRPVVLGSSGCQVQEHRADDGPTVTIHGLPGRPSHVRETIDLNVMSSPRTAFSSGFVNLSSSRFSSLNVNGASPVSGGSAPTLSGRRWIQRQVQQLLSIDRMGAPTGRISGVSDTSSNSNLNSSQIDQSRETAARQTRTQDMGTSYHTFFDERLCDNASPVMFSSRPNIDTDGNKSLVVREDSSSHIAKEQLESMVKSHLESLSQDLGLGHITMKEIERSSTHTILAVCGFEHKSEVCSVAPPSTCPHIGVGVGGGQTSLIKGCCSSCFDAFVGDVVKTIMDARMSQSQWLRLGL